MDKKTKSNLGKVAGAAAGVATGVAGGLGAAMAFSADASAAEIENEDVLDEETAAPAMEAEVVSAQPAPNVHHEESVYEVETAQVGQTHVVPPETEVEVVAYETVTDDAGNIADVAAVRVDDTMALFVDADNNGYADVVAVDENRNGNFEDNEIHDISGENISMGTFQAAYQQQHPEENYGLAQQTQASAPEEDPMVNNVAYEPTDMPDYVNDADTDAFMA